MVGRQQGPCCQFTNNMRLQAVLLALMVQHGRIRSAKVRWVWRVGGQRLRGRRAARGAVAQPRGQAGAVAGAGRASRSGGWAGWGGGAGAVAVVKVCCRRRRVGGGGLPRNAHGCLAGNNAKPQWSFSTKPTRRPAGVWEVNKRQKVGNANAVLQLLCINVRRGIAAPARAGALWYGGNVCLVP